MIFVIIELLLQHLSGLTNWKRDYDLIQCGTSKEEVSKILCSFS